jgi:hypothetical protein
MVISLFPEVYDVLEKKFGKDEAREIVKTLDLAFQATDKKVETTLEGIKDKADFLITQKKFELKDELTKELATKVDIARLEGEIKTIQETIKTAEIKLDRKFTLMFFILLFTIIFFNQNALEFIAKLIGLI